MRLIRLWIAICCQNSQGNMFFCTEFPQDGLDFHIFSFGLSIRSARQLKHKRQDFVIEQLKMPNKSRLTDASPILSYKFPEGWAKFDQRANEIFFQSNVR
jgi:hypothetical protein